MDYANDVAARRDMISAAFNAAYVKDRAAWMKTKARKYGDIFPQVVAIVDETRHLPECRRAQEIATDERLATAMNWQTDEAICAASFAAWRAKYAERP